MLLWNNMDKVVKKYNLKKHSSIEEDLAYWLSKTPAERIAAVDYLRRIYYGYPLRFQRVIRVIKRAQSLIITI